MATEASAQELHTKFETDLEQVEASALRVLIIEAIPLLRDLLAGEITDEVKSRARRVFQHASEVKQAHQQRLDALLADAARTTRSRSKEDSTGL